MGWGLMGKERIGGMRVFELMIGMWNIEGIGGWGRGGGGSIWKGYGKVYMFKVIFGGRVIIIGKGGM